MPTIDFSDEEHAAVRRSIADDKFPLSSRLAPLKSALAKLDPGSEPRPLPHTSLWGNAEDRRSILRGLSDELSPQPPPVGPKSRDGGVFLSSGNLLEKPRKVIEDRPTFCAQPVEKIIQESSLGYLTSGMIGLRSWRDDGGAHDTTFD